MSYNINLESWVDLFAHHKFQSPDFDTQMTVGWISWSCEIESLKYKTISLGKILSKILPSRKLQPDKQYICFYSFLNKVDLKTYDEIWICNSETRETIWIISVKDCKVYHRKDEFENPVYFGKYISDIINWFIKGELRGYEKLL